MRFAMLTLGGLLLATACQPGGTGASNPADAQGLPDGDPTLACRLVRKEGALLIDSRTRVEFDSGHVEGALWIPYDETAERIAEIREAAGGDQDKPIVVYCRSGRRAGVAKQTLIEHGFSQVTNLGGLDDWSDEC